MHDLVFHGISYFIMFLRKLNWFLRKGTLNNNTTDCLFPPAPLLPECIHTKGPLVLGLQLIPGSSTPQHMKKTCALSMTVSLVSMHTLNLHFMLFFLLLLPFSRAFTLVSPEINICNCEN